MAGPTVETAIWLALRGRVATLVLNPGLPIAWPKEAFSPPQVGGQPRPYLEVRHLPNANGRVFIGHDEPHMRRGILQINLKYPTAMNHAEAVQTEIAGLIAEQFPTGLKMAYGGITVHVERAPDVAQAFRDGADPYWQTPVSIRYWCEA